MEGENSRRLDDVYSAFDFRSAAAGRLDDLFRSHLAEDFVAYPPAAYPDMGEYRGLEQFKAFCRMLTDVWEEWSFEQGAMDEAGDQVLVHVRLLARGRGSGVEIREEGWHVWAFRDGKAVSLRSYLEEAAAREAAGLADLQSPG